MTVGQLIAQLQTLPPDTPVVRADSEYGPQDLRGPKLTKIAVMSEWHVEALPGRPAHDDRELDVYYETSSYQEGKPVFEALYIC